MDRDKKEDKLQRTAEDTTEILLQFIAGAAQVDEAKASKKPRSRTKSVEKARALLLGRSRCAAAASKEEVITETESEDGFVVLSKTSRVACGHNSTSTKRPATLTLQAAADPGDPPLFSPCQSYPPPTSAVGRMSLHSQSSPTMATPRIVPNCSTDTLSRPFSQMPACSESQQVRARLIAERLKIIGDKMQTAHNAEELEQNVSSLIALTSSVSRSQNLWQNVTLTFSSIYTILSNLNQQFGDSQPPSCDEDWQMFCKVCSVLRNNLIPLISSLGGWSVFLRESFDIIPAVLATTPRSHDHHMISSPCVSTTLPVSHSTPSTTSRHRILQEYQPSPGSQRSLKINRSQTLPTVEKHPLKLWRLSESGSSLVDEDGNEDFCESLKRAKEERESDFESSGLSLDNAGQLADQCSDDESEKDDLVFAMEPVNTSLSSPIIVPSPHCLETHITEGLCDSGHVSSWETLSSSSTPPRDVSFVLGSPAHHNDSAVDVSGPQMSSGKRRPKSGCTFGKKDEVPAFDRHRSRSMPISHRPRAGSDRSRRRSPVVLSSPHFADVLCGQRSISLSGVSEAVLYEAVRSLFT